MGDSKDIMSAEYFLTDMKGDDNGLTTVTISFQEYENSIQRINMKEEPLSLSGRKRKRDEFERGYYIEEIKE